MDIVVSTRYNEGDRVFYKTDGPDAMGTITSVHCKAISNDTFQVSYDVHWDDNKDNGEYREDQLGQPVKATFV